MKKIGILYGQENTFPFALIDKINSMNVPGIKAEAVQLDKVQQGATSDYAVIIDRISQDVPFYRAFLKTAAITGTAVINNPFWWSADEKFFNNSIAISVGVPVPKTYLLPSNQMPADTNANSFRNLKYPMDWNGIVEDIGFPAYMKPHAGGGWKSVYRVENLDDLFAKHNETEQLVMMLQEEIVFEEYFRCYCIGGKYVRIMQYEPRNPHHLRYSVNTPPSSQKLLDTIHDYVLRLNDALGYDFNTVEFAVRDGIPYAIDFCNPAPDADVASVGQENFDWVVETSARYAIERALAQKPGQDNLTWGNFVRKGVSGQPTTAQKASSPAAPAKRGRKAAPKAAASSDSSAPKRRGRPAKAKVEGEVKEAKRRGRPAKAKAEGEIKEVKRRGRPAKAKVEGEIKEVKRRGRPAKAKVEGEVKEAKRRGRPAKAKVEGEVKEAKRRGRPAKAKAEGEVKEAKRRGRPAKAKAEGEVKEAKRRGRPAKAKVEGEVKEVKRRGRPAKAKAEGEVKEAKRRGRQAKAKAEGEVKEVKRRGRPAKAKAEGEVKEVKRRGRPARITEAADSTAAIAAPKTRGRKPKVKAEVETAVAKRRGRPAKVTSAADSTTATVAAAKKTPNKAAKKKLKVAKIKVAAEKKARKPKAALTTGAVEKPKRGRKPKAEKVVKPKRVRIEKPFGNLMGIDAVLAAEKITKEDKN